MWEAISNLSSKKIQPKQEYAQVSDISAGKGVHGS